MTTKTIVPLSVMLMLFLNFTSSVFSQSSDSNYTISGTVIDNDLKVPLEYATITLENLDDPSKSDGVITNTEGQFSVDVSGGNYKITVEFISYETQTFQRQIDEDLDLGTIEMGISSDDLDEVVVRAETTEVSVRLDKKIYNIGKDLTTQGGTVGDALNNVPSVAVDIDGGISLRGNENVRILINGKPSAMAGFGSTDVLNQLPAEAIDRVEVITSPSARYDAEGTAGILNIILRQEKTLGFNGSVTLNAGYPDNAGISANVNLRTDKFNIFNTSGFRYFDAPGNSFSDTHYFTRINDDGELVEPEFDRITERRTINRLNRRYNTNLGMEYFLTESSSITASGFYSYGEDEDFTPNMTRRFIEGDLAQGTTRREVETEEDNRFQLSLNYEKNFNEDGHKLTADFQYGKDKETGRATINETLDFDNTNRDDFFEREEVYTEETENEYLIQADYVLPIGEETQFEAGYRGDFEEEVTDYQLLIEDIETGNLSLNENLSNIFTYTENVNALYTQYGTKFGDFSFLLGLRLENTQLKGNINSELSDEELRQEFGFAIDTDFDNNYLGLFPTINLIYELRQDEDITIGFNRRINRPRGWYINPFPSRSSRTNIFQGNPNLQPAFSSAYDIGYLKRWENLTLTSSVYYQYETDSFERVEESTGEETSDGIEIIRTLPINLSTNQRVGAELGLLYNPADWLRLNGSFNFFEFTTEGEYNDVDYGAKNTSWFARFSSKVTLPAKIEWQTNAYYRAPQEGAQTRTEGMASIDIALSKDLFSENATLSFNVRDILNSRKRQSFTTTEFFNRESEFQWRERSFNISLMYRFNQQKNERDRRNRENGDDEDSEFEG